MAVLLPEYWWPTDTGTTISQESGELYRRYGNYSVRVQATNAAFGGDLTADPVLLPTIGSGIVSSPISVRPTEFRPFLTVQMSLWVVSGAVRLELWDIKDCAAGDIDIWPPRSSTERAVTTEIGVWVEGLGIAPGEDFWRGGGGNETTQVQIAIVADEDNSEWYLDGVMLTNTDAGVTTFYDGKGSNELLLAANQELLLKSGPLSKYNLSSLDLTRLNESLWPDEDIAIGGTARLRVDDFDSLDLKRRILTLDRNLFKETDTKLELETELSFLTRNLAKTERRRRAIQVGPTDETSRPANVSGASANFENGVLEIRISPTVGAAYYEVREQGDGSTALERWDNGRRMGPRTDSTRIIITDSREREYSLSVRAYNRSGVASAQPYEFTTTNQGALNQPFMPTDIHLRLYLSFDELRDAEGNTMIPQEWSSASSTTVNELNRRRRYDQSQEENHFQIVMERDEYGPEPPTTVPQGKKPGVSNAAITFGDWPSAATRKTESYGHSWVCCDHEAATGGQSGVDMLDDFTITAWINPCLIYSSITTAEALNGANQQAIMSRMGVMSWDYSPQPAGVNWATRGWFWYWGGVPKDWSNSWSPDLSNLYGTVAGFGLYYLPNSNAAGYPAEDSNDFALTNRAALFWPWDWFGTLDASGTPGGYAADAGEYAGWQFVALRVSPTITTDPDFPDNANDFTMYAGWADTKRIIKLGTRRGVAMRSGMWTSNTGSTAGAFHVDGDQITLAINNWSINRLAGQTGDSEGDLKYDESHWGDPGGIGKYDEVRVYSRALSESEIGALYAFPGGQKRTENLLECERQVTGLCVGETLEPGGLGGDNSELPSSCVNFSTYGLVNAPFWAEHDVTDDLPPRITMHWVKEQDNDDMDIVGESLVFTPDGSADAFPNHPIGKCTSADRQEFFIQSYWVVTDDQVYTHDYARYKDTTDWGFTLDVRIAQADVRINSKTSGVIDTAALTSPADGESFYTQLYVKDSVQEGWTDCGTAPATVSGTNTGVNGTSRTVALGVSSHSTTAGTGRNRRTIYCKSKNLTVSNLATGDKAKVYHDGSLVAQATESGGTATVDLSRSGGCTKVVPIYGFDLLVVTDSSDVEKGRVWGSDVFNMILPGSGFSFSC